MKVARVTQTVVATICHPSLEGRRLLRCALLDRDGLETGAWTIAVNAVDAGIGDLVLIVDEGNGARQILDAPGAPIRAVVAGIVDDVNPTVP